MMGILVKNLVIRLLVCIAHFFSVPLSASNDEENADVTQVCLTNLNPNDVFLQGVDFENGSNGRPKNITEAVRHFKDAADRNHMGAIRRRTKN